MTKPKSDEGAQLYVENYGWGPYSTIHLKEIDAKFDKRAAGHAAGEIA